MAYKIQDKQFVRFGVIGLGGMGQAHCRFIKKTPRARLCAVCDADHARARQVGEEFSAPFFSSPSEMIRSGRCDAALIATPHPLHAEPAKQCLEAGIHVLCEKPLADRLSTARQLVDIARRRNLALAVILQCRFDPAFQAACAFIDAGRLGALRRAEMASNDYRNQAYYDSAPWRGTWRGEGGGVLLNQAPHMLDQFVRLAGRPSVINGRILTALHEIEVEDYADALLTYPNGAMGYLVCSTNDPTQGKYIALWGEKGLLKYLPDMPLSRRLCFYKYDSALLRHVKTSAAVWDKLKFKAERIKVAPKPWGQIDVIADMVEHLYGKAKPACSGAEAVASVELANAITLSSWQKRPVTLPFDEKLYDRLLAARRRAAPAAKKIARTMRVTDPRLRR